MNQKKRRLSLLRAISYAVAIWLILVLLGSIILYYMNLPYLESKLDGMQTWHFIYNNKSLPDPTYDQMEKFIKEDEVDENEYVESDNKEEAYVCHHFAVDVVKHAARKNIRAGYVFLEYSDSDISHAIVCFDTVDRGLIFIEPQTDEEVKIVVGGNFWRGVQASFIRRVGQIIENLIVGHDDKISMIIIEWHSMPDLKGDT